MRAMGINKSAQMKVQQMSFFILAIFLFFMLVGMFFIMLQYRDVQSSAESLQKDQAISSLETISNMPELVCDTGEPFCLDFDKVLVFREYANAYADFLPVASINVYKLNPLSNKVIRCPAENCTYYEIYSSGQTRVQEYSTFVSICQKEENFGRSTYDCSLGKISVGVTLIEE
jgi:hypothetical protein